MGVATQGILFGIGVGPGDPDLLTLAAVKALGNVRMVFTPASAKNDFSVALDIIRPHLAPDAGIQRLEFPMTRDDQIRQEARRKNAAQVLEYLNTGQSAAFITLGDPLIYSTFGHVLRSIRTWDAGVDIRIIPGVTSFQAAAARLERTLVEGEETLVVATGHTPEARLERLLGEADATVILKPAKRLAELKTLLRSNGLEERTTLITRCGLSEEAVYSDLEAIPEPLSYFSLALVNRESGQDFGKT
ncbi:precorrin-2 C(20)-methyltransferase [Desulfonatronum thioautotrophicum]|uniref:precorrin-2 C(20)-methyltransferase n=1 Tax=Desulfonatronum thioautotrophicum TaxID=617001 RepID=UPI0005EAE1FC|nr:precorrin-2 C(20)-methyltransferase [Desulfonatronum thioautotrophicum]